MDEEGTAAGTAAPVARISPERQCLTWSRVHLSNSTFIPPPRSGAASVVVGKKLYVAFGYGGGTGRLDDMYSYDFERNVWEEVQVIGTERPGCRENNGLVSLDNYIILWGGYSGEIWLNDLWRFDIQSHRWECIQESSDTGPAQEASFLMEDAATQPMALGPAWQVRGKAPSRRFGCVSVVHEGKLIVWAGFDGSRWLNCMCKFKGMTCIYGIASLTEPRCLQLLQYNALNTLQI